MSGGRAPASQPAAPGPRSVESAFNYAHSKLGKNYSNLPVMRDGVPGPAIADCVRTAGADVIFVETECFV